MKTKKENLILHAGEASEFPIALTDSQFVIYHDSVCDAMELACVERRRAQRFQNVVFLGFVAFSAGLLIYKFIRERGVKAAAAAAA